MGLYDRDWYADAHLHTDQAHSQDFSGSALVQIPPSRQATVNTPHGDNNIFILPSPPQELPDKHRAFDCCPKCRSYNPESFGLCYQCGHIHWGFLLYATGLSAACLLGAAFGYQKLPGEIWPLVCGIGLGLFGFTFTCFTIGEWIAVVSSFRKDSGSAKNFTSIDGLH